jgi:Uma2 family endonuclease
MATVATPATAFDLTDLLLEPSPDGRVRFSREAYHFMAQSGMLPDRRIELIDGEIYRMPPIGPPQGSLITRLMNFFIRQLPAEYQCRVQLPIVVSDHSEPEPDLAIVRHRDDDYQKEHPTPADVVLLVEVAQSSLEFDLGKKLQLYSTSGIAEYWVVNIERRSILVHRTPSGNEYRDVTIVQAGDAIAPLAAPKCRLDIEWLFH